MRYLLLLSLLVGLGCSSKPFRVECEEKDIIKNMCRHPKFIEVSNEN